MNLLQHCLLKLGEESGEIATALLAKENLIVGVSALSNTQEINLEVNDLEAVIRKLNCEFAFEYCIQESNEHKLGACEYANKDMAFWVMFTVNSCLALSKISSKCIQFGLKEKHPDLNKDNHQRLCLAIHDVFFGIKRLNEFGLGYEVDELYISNKLIKINHYLQYSISLNCVNDFPEPKKINLDEYSPDSSKIRFTTQEVEWPKPRNK